jgi:hypothetical protein
MVPRNGGLHALERFLCKNSQNGRINSKTIDTLMKMARLVLDTNCFVYEVKYYRQVRGGPMGLAFNMTFVNICMLDWK